MKFGQNFHLYQVPEWESLYVSYNRLKKVLNEAARTCPPRKQPDLSELYVCLTCNIDALERFHSDKYHCFQQKEAELCRIYGLSLQPSTIPALEEADHLELEDLFEATLELRNELTKLRWHLRVNQDAINRIYTKIEKVTETIDQSHHDQRSRWTELQLTSETSTSKILERLDQFIANVRRNLTHAPSTSAHMSLRLKALGGQKSPASVSLSALCHAIKADQSVLLAEQLGNEISNKSTPNFKELHCALLEFSMMCQSRECIDFLLSDKFLNNGVSPHYHCLNRLIAIAGRKSLRAGHEDSESRSKGLEDLSHGDVEGPLLVRLLQQFVTGRESVLQAKDPFGRLPLHYSALFGLPAVCQLILDSLRKCGEDSSTVREAILAADSEGQSPLHYAVIHGRTAITKLFLDALQVDPRSSVDASEKDQRSLLSGLVFVAIKYQFDDVVNLLVSSNIDTNFQSSQGETALYVAARLGQEQYVRMLLRLTPAQTSTIDVPDEVFGWTPLIVACVEGHLAVVKLLLHAGASQAILDHRGWTAREHAAFRGHLEVAQRLKICGTEDPTRGPADRSVKGIAASIHHLRTGRSLIVAHLGVMQKDRRSKAVNLKYCSLEYTPNIPTETRFSIEISARGSSGPNYLVQFPILDDMVNEPLVFPIENPNDAQLTFSIFRKNATSGEKGALVGSGTAMLESQRHGFGAKHESLLRDHSVPILERETLVVIGTVTFTFVIAKPFAGSKSPPPIKNTTRVTDRTQLVGHRGLGQNTASCGHLQLGENTIESFLSAAKLGASLVEFDVQITRDLVPIIYHDFSLSESGTDIPIHDLSLEQFMYASNIQSPRGNPVSLIGKPMAHAERNTFDQSKPRSRSLTRERESGAREVQDRMKHTVDFLKKGFKPNTRGDFIQDSFATLEELLVKLPSSIGFDIEIKYPRLHEAKDAGVAPVGIELNTFIDSALEKIFRFGGERTIILSSFTPEVCILLAIKQQAYPVMFITNAGKPPMSDLEMRASSLQVAVRFAKLWDLAGIVFASETLTLCPRLVQYVKRSGLICASYGSENSIPEKVKIQAEAGLDIIMADRVGLIARTLEKRENE